NNVASTFRQLQVPIALQYQISRKIFASAGLRYSYLTAAPDDLTFPAGSFQADLSSSKSILIDNNLVRRSDLAASFGLGFNLGKHFLLRMDYFHGFSPYLDFDKSGSRSDYHRTFNLGLSYYIGP
ncbi:MAG: outer membrane beta-barrel protein, partial [Eudoraea sp.]|nr:outer membrane beta-barrel protein [Eudoraea sp.]